MRLLIDECLSPIRALAANKMGFEAYHVAHFGWAGVDDRQLFRRALEHGFLIVSNNGEDFLRLARPVELYCGLIWLIPRVRRERQLELFNSALATAAAIDMVNRVIEVDDAGRAVLYDLPGR